MRFLLRNSFFKVLTHIPFFGIVCYRYQWKNYLVFYDYRYFTKDTTIGIYFLYNGGISMEFIDMEQLAFIIAKELGVDKSNIDLVKSIRKDREEYYSALKQIPVEIPKAKVMKNPF